jgi:hypothetical protein
LAGFSPFLGCTTVELERLEKKEEQELQSSHKTSRRASSNTVETEIMSQEWNNIYKSAASTSEMSSSREFLDLSPRKAPQRTKSEESTKSKKRSRHTQRRTVSFAPTKAVRPTLSVIDYTRGEVKACWYEEHEYDLIIQECLKVIKKMQEGKPINARKYCVRGLDRFAPEAADLRELNKSNAYIAVLEEQNNQLRDGHCDPQEIARHYRAAASRRCQLEAQNVGERDALFVQKVLNSCVR